SCWPTWPPTAPTSWGCGWSAAR
ncbi:MAG: hypothetical protein AVDCRST_MAG48-310, partial [uncultured Friedmanniella sp.]